MALPTYVFETDPKIGQPRLRFAGGPSFGWTQKDIETVEELLLGRYQSLATDGVGILEYKGTKVQIHRKANDATRQPTLELMGQEVVSLVNGSTGFRLGQIPLTPMVQPKPIPPTTVDWFKGFLHSVDALLDGERSTSLDEAEKAMIAVVLKEIRSLGERRPAAEVSAMFLGALVFLADRLSRVQQPNKLHPYPYALNGIEKLLDRESPTPWGEIVPTATATEKDDMPPSWFHRFWGRAKV